MLLRKEGEDVIAITQPAHAWVAGQLARHWGNNAFGSFEPHEEVSLAAALHDVGFLDWEMAPTLNSKTGLPHTFLELPAQAHLGIWTKSIQQVLKYDRYAALLVSMHFTWLCESQPSQVDEDRSLEKKFRGEQEQLQTSIITSLENDYYYGPLSGEGMIQRNRELVSLWDWLSLLLCMGLQEERVIENVRTAGGVTHLKLCPKDESGTRVSVEPWPFQDDSVSLRCEGRQLVQTYSRRGELQEALRAASPVTLKFELVRR
ncbi:DUF3891 family protein [Pedosphaera parvula]|uniref:DUF3891 family protein n=1 Tax=Pedosphaera parvula (strain Ellin514) TaxID=320771 RepID=B9XFH0_PEDPL|nr:DUF3891 family protein [Pedosphaera parvula]EEF61334.1 conserved hypothetical protein [Pedosphaera parvula Ellin514]